MPTPNYAHARPLTPRLDEKKIRDYAELVEESTRYGSNLIDRLISSHSENLEELACILLLRQTVELLDAIQIGLRQGSIDP